MERPAVAIKRQSRRSASRGLAWIGGAIAWTAAAAIAAVLALTVAATVVVVSLMGLVLVTLAGAAIRVRRPAPAVADPNLIEARNIGGHSWVAYGWDGRR
jgi:hypothetical protein